MVGSVRVLRGTILLAIVLSFASCLRMTYLPNPIQATQNRKSPDEMVVLYDRPDRPYDVLGILQVKRYKPGFFDPVLTDVLPEMKEKAAEVGGDAFIIQKTAADGRTLTIYSEVIRYRN